MSNYKTIKEVDKFWHYKTETYEVLSAGNLNLMFRDNIIRKIKVSTGNYLIQSRDKVTIMVGPWDKAAQVSVFNDGGRMVFTAYGKIKGIVDAKAFADACEQKNLIVFRVGF